MKLMQVTLALLMTSCTILPGTLNAPTNDFCLIAPQITYSDKDTAETKREIMEYDVKGMKLCKWK